MKIPNKVKIAGVWFRIKKCKALSDENGLVLLGQCDVARCIIDINTDYPMETQISTLFHEILEALSHMNELKLEHNIISALETGIYQVLKDNRMLK